MIEHACGRVSVVLGGAKTWNSAAPGSPPKCTPHARDARRNGSPQTQRTVPEAKADRMRKQVERWASLLIFGRQQFVRKGVRRLHVWCVR